MPPAFRCRNYRAGDYPAIRALWEATDLSGPQRGDSAASIERTLAQGGRFLVLEEDPGRAVAGTAWLTMDGRRSYLHHFGIRPDLQGRGLGRALLVEVLAAARALGLQLKLEVDPDNDRARNLYLGGGFRSAGTFDILMIRDLDAASAP